MFWGLYTVFSYKANEDSVLQVIEPDYKNCSSASPIAKYSDGHTLITLNQSGPHYFISGVVDHCKHNEKLVIVVLADRSNHTSSPPSASPPALPPAPTSEQFASPPPAPSAPEPDLNPAPAPAHSDENPPPSPTPNGASSMVVNFFSFFGAFVGFVIFNF
ncbi:early nodulin-like protein 12 [Bidens hawaiensis]|uniref:early nodulin-like protein 12 n=1 Tax=Bidens hawaiensis TaxID=980011 RepID=UPI00404B5950